MKPQAVRLVDVFILGPFMVAAAAELRRTRPQMARWMRLAGVATVLYNAWNYQSRAQG